MLFRTDINGLRAIAVLSVVVFHFSPNLVASGFIGVDIFFVISGYLMTSIIVKRQLEGNFSLKDFYLQRARRIFPPLWALCSFLLVFGAFFLTGKDFHNLSKHVFSSLSFVSNIIYQLEGGYFDVASKDKWLLHTWSLSVEWQFYLIYPIVLTGLISCFGENNISKSLSCLTLIVIICSGVFSSVYPELSYYGLHTRMPEMLIGGLAFFYKIKKYNYSEYLVGAILMLLISILLFLGKVEYWPGYIGYFPVLLTSLIIIFRTDLLNAQTLQVIGKYSYSIYLWHWVVVVLFYKLHLFHPIYIFLGLLLSFLLGRGSYLVFEQGVGDKVKSNKLGRLGIICYLIILIISLFSYVSPKIHNLVSVSDVNEGKISPARGRCHTSKSNQLAVDKSCNLNKGKATWASIGDSHTVELAFALSEIINLNNESLIQYSHSGCGPSYLLQENNYNCTQWTNDVIESVLNNKNIQKVLVGYRYSLYLNNGSQENTLVAFKRMVELLSSQKKIVYVLLPIPSLKDNINNIFLLSNLFGNYDVDLKTIDEYFDENSRFFDYLNKQVWPSNVRFIDPTKALCHVGSCLYKIDNKSLYFDDNHVSIQGARKIIDLMRLKEK